MHAVENLRQFLITIFVLEFKNQIADDAVHTTSDQFVFDSYADKSLFTRQEHG